MFTRIFFVIAQVDFCYNKLTRKNGINIVHLLAQVTRLQRLHNNWKSLCKQTVQSGMQMADSMADVDLERRLELVTRDVAVAIDILQHGIAQEKTPRRNRTTDETTDRTLELARQLRRVEEELQLKEDVTTATIRRQENEMNTERNDKSVSCTRYSQCDERLSSFGQTVEQSSIQPTAYSRTEHEQGQLQEQELEHVTENVEMLQIQVPKLLQLNESKPSTSSAGSELRHQERIKKKYSWLVDKIIAPSAAARMYEQGAITFRENESIWRSKSPSQSAEKLINIVVEQPYAVFRCLKTALKDTKQDDVYLALADIGG